MAQASLSSGPTFPATYPSTLTGVSTATLRLSSTSTLPTGQAGVLWSTALLGLALALAVLPLLSIALLVAGLVALLVAVAYPAYLLALLALAVPYGDVLRVPVGGLSLTATEGALVGVALAWLCRCALQRAIILHRPGVWFPIGALLTVSLLSAAGAPSLSLALKELVKWLEFGLAMTLAMQLVRTEQERKAVLTVLVLVGASQALYGVAQTSSGAGPIGFLLASGTLRAFGTFGQPNPYAVYLATTLCVVTGIGLSLAAHDWRKLLTPFGLLLMMGAGLLAAGMLGSYSRSAWLALILAVGVMIALRGRMLALLGVSTLALLALLAQSGALELLPASIAGRFAGLWEMVSLFDARMAVLTSENFAVVHRMAIWQAAWEMFQENPWLGVGPGNFDIAYPLYALPGWPQVPGHAHNFYLNLLAETGIAGLIAYVGLLLFMGTRAFIALMATRAVGNPMRYGAALAGFGLIAFLSVYQLFDNLYVHSMTAQAGLIFGLAIAAATPGYEHHHP